MRVYIESSGRLHIGLIDLHGGLGRKFGSIGVALKEPSLVLEAAPADELRVEGLEQERTKAFAQCFFQRYAPEHRRLSGRGAYLRVFKAIPPHVGFGSGTQLALAIGVALMRLYDLDIPVVDLAKTMGRGRRSGIGIGAFQHGGFIVDGGSIEDSHGEETVPPVIFRHPFPADWLFVVATPQVGAGLSDEAELTAFHELPSPPPEVVDHICRILVMKMLPSLIEGKIKPFGEAMTRIEQLVGDIFSDVQGGHYASIASERLVAYMLEQGAYGAGQSSWGPTVYGLVRGEEQAQSLAEAVRSFVEGKWKSTVFYTAARNEGFYISTSAVRGRPIERIAWGITGGGNFLAASVDLLTKLRNVDLFLSRAGEEVKQIYGLMDKIKQSGVPVYRESRSPSCVPFAMRFSKFSEGAYDALVIAPATANSVAKFASGIADSLITNLFAQAGKFHVPIIVLPTDIAPEVYTQAPKKESGVWVYPRWIDLENINRLRAFQDVTVVTSVEELNTHLENLFRGRSYYDQNSIHNGEAGRPGTGRHS